MEITLRTMLCLSLPVLVGTTSSAHAILTRHNFTNGSPDYQRYVNLANQSRFYSVGAVGIKTPFATAATSQGMCTGSMITSSIVLTAAHCMYAIDSSTNQKVSAYTPGATPYKGTFTNGASVGFGGGPT